MKPTHSTNRHQKAPLIISPVQEEINTDKCKQPLGLPNIWKKKFRLAFRSGNRELITCVTGCLTSFVLLYIYVQKYKNQVVWEETYLYTSYCMKVQTSRNLHMNVKWQWDICSIFNALYRWLVFCKWLSVCHFRFALFADKKSVYIGRGARISQVHTIKYFLDWQITLFTSYVFMYPFWLPLFRL